MIHAEYRGMLVRAAASTVAVAAVTFVVIGLLGTALGISYSWGGSGTDSVPVAFALFAVGLSGLMAGGLLLARWTTGRDWPAFAIASVGLVIWTILYDPGGALSLLNSYGIGMMVVVYIGEILLTLPAQAVSWYILTRDWGPVGDEGLADGGEHTQG